MKISEMFVKARSNRHEKMRGFTLIEMAIVLLIIGIVAAAFFSVATILVKKQKIESMELRMRDVHAAFAEFTKDEIPDPDLNPPPPDDEVRFPCPASLTAGPDDPDFGMEIACPATAPAVGTDLGGVFVLEGAAGGVVLVGAVPTHTMGVSGELMMDEFGNRLTYAVTYGLTQEDALLESGIAEGQIRIINHADAPVSQNADYFVFSSGEDGAGAYTAEGVPYGTSCRTTVPPGGGDSRNCLWQTDNQAIFRGRTDLGSSTKLDEGFYDDYTQFVLDDEDGWWHATDLSGQDITHSNTRNVYFRNRVRVGPLAMEPQAELDVQGTALFSNRIGVGTTNPQMEMDIAGNGTISGNLGIGTATPQAQLDVSGNTLIGGSVGIGLPVADITPSSTLEVAGEVEAGNTGIDCTADNIGAMRYNPTRDKMEYCSTTGWRIFFSTSECTIRSGPVKNDASLVLCNSDEFVISGGATCASSVPGGLCYGTPDGNTKGYIHVSRPISEGWEADCFGVMDDTDVCVQAHAVCCKK